MATGLLVIHEARDSNVVNFYMASLQQNAKRRHGNVLLVTDFICWRAILMRLMVLDWPNGGGEWR